MSLSNANDQMDLDPDVPTMSSRIDDDSMALDPVSEPQTGQEKSSSGDTTSRGPDLIQRGENTSNAGPPSGRDAPGINPPVPGMLQQ
jgi:hypothetical protein